MAPRKTWYKGTIDKLTITEIEFKDSYTPTETIIEQWNADENDNGDIKCYIIGTKLYIVGNGSGKIAANKICHAMFTNFAYVRAISGINLLDTSKTTSMYYMFCSCNMLTDLDLSNFDTSKVTDMESMFRMCRSLTNLNLSNFDTSKVTNMESMFNDCRNLITIYVSDLWSTTSVTSSGQMFSGCTSLVGAVPYDSTKTDASMANYTTGYLTYKASN